MRVVVVSGGPSRKNYKRQIGDMVIAVNKVCFEMEADYYAGIDQGLINKVTALGRYPNLGWISGSGNIIPNKVEKIVPKRLMKLGCRYTCPLALSVAFTLTSGIVELYGCDFQEQDDNHNHTSTRWAIEAIWLHMAMAGGSVRRHG
jgi:hypothetical protein